MFVLFYGSPLVFVFRSEESSGDHIYSVAGGYLSYKELKLYFCNSEILYCCRINKAVAKMQIWFSAE